MPLLIAFAIVFVIAFGLLLACCRAAKYADQIEANS